MMNPRDVEYEASLRQATSMVENNYHNKKLINEERIIAFEIESQETDKLPKGEHKIEQKGNVGKKQVTALQTYQEGVYIEEEIIEEIIEQEPVKEIVYIGTSEYLNKYNIHIGEEMYLIEPGDIKKEASEQSDTIYSIISSSLVFNSVGAVTIQPAIVFTSDRP